MPRLFDAAAPGVSSSPPKVYGNMHSQRDSQTHCKLRDYPCVSSVKVTIKSKLDFALHINRLIRSGSTANNMLYFVDIRNNTSR